MSHPITRRDLLIGGSGTLLTSLLGPARGSVLAQSAAPTVDIHCHVFNVLDLPIDGFVLALGHGMGLPNVLDPGLSVLTSGLHELLVGLAKERTDGSDAAQYEARIQAWAVGELASTPWALPNSIIKTLELITRPRLYVARELAQTYPGVSLFAPALVDYEHWTNHNRRGKARRTETPLDRQIDEHAKVFDDFNRAGGVSMHGYVPFNPLHQVHYEQAVARGAAGGLPNPMGELRRAIGIDGSGRGFIGVKLYPATGFLPLGNVDTGEFKGTETGRALDRVMLDFFELCEDEQIPILSHTSMGNGFGPNYAWRGSPWGWLRVLEEFSDLRLDLAHFGHLEGVPKKGVVLDCLAWSKRIAGELMTEEHPHVYADLGFSPVALHDTEGPQYEAYFERELLPIKHEDGGRVVERRVMYGTDWWMSCLTGKHASYLSAMRAAWQRLALKAHPSDSAARRAFEERFFGGNALRFIGVLDEQGKADPTSPAYKRLATYYAKLQRTSLAQVRLPSWLTRGA